MPGEIEQIIEKLASDYEDLKDECLCHSGPVYCAYLNSTDTFRNHVVRYIDGNLQTESFFLYVLLCYREKEEKNIFEQSKKIIDNTFVINDLTLYLKCNCLQEHFNVISLQYIERHREMYSACKNYGTSYVSALEKARTSLANSKERVLTLSNLTTTSQLHDFIYDCFYYEPINTGVYAGKRDYLKEYFFYYDIVRSLIDKHNDEKPKSLSVINVDVDEIEKIYKENGIFIKKDDVQFNKYGLLSLNNNVIINHASPIGKVYDVRISNTLSVHTSGEILKIFAQLLNEQLIVNLALKPMSLSFSSSGLESIERGAPLTSQIKNLPAISCFFDKSYADKLIITHSKEKNEITFEELRDDFTLQGDAVVTQVVHLKYNESNDNYFIEHLDHEYILYDLDEYQKKEKNIIQKGSLGKIKTFKIDNSAIPFFYKHKGSYFLFIVLEEYFLNKNLLVEYFLEINDWG